MKLETIVWAWAGLLVIYVLANELLHPKAVCPLCGGRKRHRDDCPQKDRDE